MRIAVILLLSLLALSDAWALEAKSGATASATSKTTAILSWEPSPSPKVVGYRVYIGTTPGVYSWSINVGSATTYTVSNLAVGNYYFAVRAYSASGAESGYSNEVSKTITRDSGTQLTARRPSEFP
jgi:hypothetical protein